MGLILILPLLAIGIFFAVVTIRRLVRQRAGVGAWILFFVLAGLGNGAGAWATHHRVYQPTPAFRVTGFPIPIQFERLEDGKWIVTEAPGSIQTSGLIANAALGGGLFALPLWTALWWRERKQTKKGPENSPGPS